MTNNGWIKLHRKILQSQMYKNLNSKQRDVLMVCLLSANHQENEWEWGSDMYKCEPGQFITSLDSLSQKCGKDVKVQSVRTSLLKLQKWGFLTNKSTKTGRLITVLNWAKYQVDETDTNKDTNKQPTKSQQSPNKELTTNKNVKNDNNDKNEKKRVSRFAPPSLSELNSYISDNNLTVNGEQFIDFYTSKGWKIGSNPMKDWKATARNWSRRDKKTKSSNPFNNIQKL